MTDKKLAHLGDHLFEKNTSSDRNLEAFSDDGYAWWWRIEYYRSSPLRTEYSPKIRGIHPRDVSMIDAIFGVFQEITKRRVPRTRYARGRGYSASRTKLAHRSWRPSPLKRNKMTLSPRIMMSTTQHLVLLKNCMHYLFRLCGRRLQRWEWHKLQEAQASQKKFLLLLVTVLRETFWEDFRRTLESSDLKVKA